MFLPLFWQIIPLISEIYFNRWIKFVFVQTQIPIKHIGITGNDQVNNVRWEYRLIGQQSLVVQGQREAIENLSPLLHLPWYKCLFNKVAHFDIVHAVEVEVEEVIVVGQFLGDGCFAGEGRADDPDCRRAGVHGGFFGFVDSHFYCICDTAFRQIVYDHFGKFIFVDFFEYFDIFVIIFFFFEADNLIDKNSV